MFFCWLDDRICNCAERCRWWCALVGNKVDAFGGTLSFTLGHSEYNSLGLGAQEEYDLILESKTLGINLGHKHIVPGQLSTLIVSWHVLDFHPRYLHPFTSL